MRFHNKWSAIKTVEHSKRFSLGEKSICKTINTQTHLSILRTQHTFVLCHRFVIRSAKQFKYRIIHAPPHVWRIRIWMRCEMYTSYRICECVGGLFIGSISTMTSVRRWRSWMCVLCMYTQFIEDNERNQRTYSSVLIKAYTIYTMRVCCLHVGLYNITCHMKIRKTKHTDKVQ